jgi:hypothetical protein
MATDLVACLMAEGVSLDSMTGRLTAFNMLEVIFTKKFPAMLPKMFVVTVYETEGEPERFHERVSVVDPGGKVLMSSGSEIVATANTHRSINALWGTRFDADGTYMVRVERAAKADGPWKQIGKRVLTVVGEGHPLFPKEPETAKGPTPSTEASSPVVVVE